MEGTRSRYFLLPRERFCSRLYTLTDRPRKASCSLSSSVGDVIAFSRIPVKCIGQKVYIVLEFCDKHPGVVSTQNLGGTTFNCKV